MNVLCAWSGNHASQTEASAQRKTCGPLTDVLAVSARIVIDVVAPAELGAARLDRVVLEDDLRKQRGKRGKDGRDMVENV